MKSQWRLLLTGDNDGYTNMAIDEAVIEAYRQGRAPATLRIYGWQPAAFSLGYFQDAIRTLDIEKCKKENIIFVRRITGGGALFHCRELTYSLVCSSNDFKQSLGVADSFKSICSFITNAYKRMGLAPVYASEAGGCRLKKPAGGAYSFCFASQEKYDILIGAKKIGGNAQKRSKDSIFQHGSIPLESSIQKAVSFLRDKPKDIASCVCSLEEAAGRRISFAECARILLEAFQETFSAELISEALTEVEQEQALRLIKEKYASAQWNISRQDVTSCQKAPVAQ
jgi:lipoate-protein ligase A